ncbi:MAG: subtilase family N-terminal domain-containing protein, partial [Alistipes sp.]|nr:subtilase family N-terminal domain-containing protein [Alistipes sp.]
MNKVKISLFALAAIFAVSCVQDPVMEESTAVTAEAAIAKKFINTAEEANAGTLILFVDEQTAEAWTSSEVATRSGVEVLDATVAEAGVESIEQVFNMNINREEKMALDMHRWFTVKFSAEADLEQVAHKFAAISGVKRVQFSTKLARPQVKVKPVEEKFFTRASEEMPFNDPMLEQQWHYDNQGLQSIYKGAKKGEDINAFAAWKHTAGNNQVIVAVVDEGVKYDHPDLKNNMWVNPGEIAGNGKDDDDNGYVDDVYGLNAVKGTGNITWDRGGYFPDGKGGQEWDGDSGHGTHVAGTVAAVNNNGIGVAGVAGGSGNGDGVRIMSIQIFDGVDNTGLEQNARGITYAADMGASVLQNSWGYPSDPARMNDSVYEQAYGVEYTALKYFQSKNNCPAMQGGVVIFAAGNEAKASADYPGAYNEFLCVTAYGPDG